VGNLLDWLVKIRWWLIGLTDLLLIYREFEELPLNPLGATQVSEYFLYTAFLLFIGILLDKILRANARQAQSFYVLGQKHQLAIDLATNENWDGLLHHLVQYPATQAPVDEVQLFVYNSVTNQFEKVGEWKKGIGESAFLPDFYNACQQCTSQRQGFNRCHDKDLSGKARLLPEYCLPIYYGVQTLGLLRFTLETGAQLTPVQNEIFSTVGDEMGVAIKAHQERQKNIEMQRAETSLAERRSVSHYLHDNLSQNLAYLCLKLSQMKIDQSLADHQNDFEQMFNAANEMHGIIRNTIETNHPTTLPVLENLLAEHANKFSKRANVVIEITHQGKSNLISPEVQRAVFYTFQELLSNIEKHAHAKKVEVLLEWCTDQLILKISDDGIGFKPEAIDHKKHIGLEIVFEHIDKVNGRINLVSQENSGTTVTIIVPLSHKTIDGDITYEYAT
jgi:signal transduction histidine kinase